MSFSMAPAAMGQHDSAQLRVTCVGCSAVINVPDSLMPRLIASGKFSCPGCQTSQEVMLPGDWNSPVWQHLAKLSAKGMVDPQLLMELKSRQVRGAPAVHVQPDPAAPFLQAASRRAQNTVRRAEHGVEAEAEAEHLLEMEAEEEEHHVESSAFTDYLPKKLNIGRRHPDPVVETASLASVDPPDISYTLKHEAMVTHNKLSALQLEAIVYACQRHEQTLPDGHRAGFFIGDGAGVGKGRTLAGLLMENWACGRRRHLWVSTSNDLKIDARRDLDDVDGQEVEVHPLNKQPYGRLDASNGPGIKEGVVFSTYSSLIAQSDQRRTRLKQLLEWCGEDFDGLILFDECHKAKNLVPDKGKAQTAANATRTGLAVLEIQNALPKARVVYCSATGASEPRHLGYMVRLGLWGAGNLSFANFGEFLAGLGSRGMAALELVAMDMKARGMYVSRSLSFANCTFETMRTELAPDFNETYNRSAELWCKLREEFMAAEAAGAEGSSRAWRIFWSAHQRFFRGMCMSAKVPAVVAKAEEVLAAGHCVVIGLQSTGEAAAAGAMQEKGVDLDDFVSGPRETLLKLVDEHFPLPRHPDEWVTETMAELKELKEAKALIAGLGSRRARAAPVSYNTRIRVTSDSDTSGESSSEDEEDSSSGEDSSDGQAGSQDQEEAAARSDSEASGSSSEEEDDEEGGKKAGRIRGRIRRPPPRKRRKAIQEEEEAEGAGPVASSARPSAADACLEEDPVAVEAAAAQLKEEEARSGYAVAKARYDAAKAVQAQLRDAVLAVELPPNPLDDIIDRLGGSQKVAEMTGRKGRFIRQKNGAIQWEARNASGVPGTSLEMINVAERELFQAGKKVVAVISEAASAGISLHADRRVKNKRRRVHFTLELPWSADKAIQQFGRSHRSNEVLGPQYHLCFTNLGGERRFAAAVSRRLATLGALTQGDRRAGPSLGEYNYESEWGRSALGLIACELDLKHFGALMRGHLMKVGIMQPRSGSISTIRSITSTGLASTDAVRIPEVERTSVPRFLNRLLGLRPDAQMHLFDLFQDIMATVVAKAKREGTYDDGIVDVKGDVSVTGPPRVVYTDLFSKADTLHEVLQVDRGVSWEKANRMLELCLPSATELEQYDREQRAGAAPVLDASLAPAPARKTRSRGAANGRSAKAPAGADENDEEAAKGEEAADAGLSGFYRSNKKRDGVYYVLLAMQRPGAAAATVRVTRPATGTFSKEMPISILRTRYTRVEGDEAQALWDALYSGSFGSRVRSLQLLRGLILPVWGVVEAALLRSHAKAKVKVIRVLVRAPPADAEAAEAGADASPREAGGGKEQRLVGILVPEAVLPAVLEGLATQQAYQQRAYTTLALEQRLKVEQEAARAAAEAAAAVAAKDAKRTAAARPARRAPPRVRRPTRASTAVETYGESLSSSEEEEEEAKPSQRRPTRASTAVENYGESSSSEEEREEEGEEEEVEEAKPAQQRSTRRVAPGGSGAAARRGPGCQARKRAVRDLSSSEEEEEDDSSQPEDGDTDGDGSPSEDERIGSGSD
eukprot:jgi/Tetstr1/424146/TSEL_014753.t1